MTRLQRLQVRPDAGALTGHEAGYVRNRFVEFAGEVLVHHEPVPWSQITALQVVKAARAGGLAGLVVRYLVHGSERYHVGIYYDGREAVLPNVTLGTARYIVQSIAFYAPGTVEYDGPPGLSPTVDPSG